MLYSNSTGGFYLPGIHTDIPTDAEEITEEEHENLLKPRPIPLTFDQQVAANEAAIDAAMEKIVTDKGYDSIASMLSKYASDIPITGTDPVSLLREKWRLQANAFASYPGTVWAQAYLYLETVTAKTNPLPTPEQAVAMMPVFTWPD